MFMFLRINKMFIILDAIERRKSVQRNKTIARNINTKTCMFKTYIV